MTRRQRQVNSPVSVLPTVPRWKELTRVSTSKVLSASRTSTSRTGSGAWVRSSVGGRSPRTSPERSAA
ncbi:hypothetical protein [Lysobacter gummosus]|uniref:hypothetical protein n=1 Tax=Lysobacter gummosus TaxID=262324 RepID=UPI003630A63A